MLFILVATPTIVLVAFAHGLLRTYAPSNVLIRRALSRHAKVCGAAELGTFALLCAVTANAISIGIGAGAPAWLNVVALILAWNAVKYAVAGASLAFRPMWCRLAGSSGRRGTPWDTGST